MTSNLNTQKIEHFGLILSIKSQENNRVLNSYFLVTPKNDKV